MPILPSEVSRLYSAWKDRVFMVMEKNRLTDTVAVEFTRGGTRDLAALSGLVVAELFGADGTLKYRCVASNLITQVGDQYYGERASGIASPPAQVTGMKLGLGSTAVAKTGAGAALVTYLTNSHQAIDGSFPTSSLSTGRVITWKTTWSPGKATTASAITEVVIINDTLADATSAAAATISRALLTGVASKGASDTLAVTWTHTLLGA